MHPATCALCMTITVTVLVGLGCSARAAADAYRTDCQRDEDCVEAFYDACAVCPDGAINRADQDEMSHFREENDFCPRAPVYLECRDVEARCRTDECELVERALEQSEEQ
jgi:hypothetical protein